MPKKPTVSKAIHPQDQSTSVSNQIQPADALTTRLERLESRLGTAVSVQPRGPNRYPTDTRNAQVHRYLQILEECGNPVTAADMVGVTFRTIHRWRTHSASFSKKYDESLRIGELNIEHQLAGKMDSEAMSKPFDKVTGVLSMFRMKKLNPQYKDNPQLQVNLTGPAAMQFVVSQDASSPQADTTTGSGQDQIEKK